MNLVIKVLELVSYSTLIIYLKQEKINQNVPKKFGLKNICDRFLTIFCTINRIKIFFYLYPSSFESITESHLYHGHTQISHHGTVGVAGTILAISKAPVTHFFWDRNVFRNQMCVFKYEIKNWKIEKLNYRGALLGH